MFSAGARQRERTQVEADIVSIQRQITGYQQVIADVKTARLDGKRVDYDLTVQGDLAELMLGVLEDQLDEQFAVLKVLVPKQKPS